ncbi:MAG TPA: protein-S-isoprenylcysteine O-methyltransferase [Myxococcota bacterium]|jgi:protein-S-isoprenylcysteine O-methyltransferase Ste14
MDENVARVVFCVLWVLQLLVRLPHMVRNRKNIIVSNSAGSVDKALLAITITTGAAVPVLYLATGFPSLADYPFSSIAGWAGTACAIGGAFFLWRSHADLGLNWSSSVEVRAQHELVARGVYARIRHPMYTGMAVCTIAQTLLLPNWLIGPCGFVAFLAFYAHRVPREEQLMLATLGEPYAGYMRRTHRLWPRLRKASR